MRQIIYGVLQVRRTPNDLLPGGGHPHMKRREFISLLGGATAGVNSNVASLDPAQIAKLLNKSCQPSPDLKLGLGERSQYGYAPHALYLLRAYGNRPAEMVVNAPPDGYTLLVATFVNAVNATLYDKLNFSFIRDIAPVASIAREPFAIEVHPSAPVKTVPEFITHAKANPGRINMASAGAGSGNH